MTSTDLAVSQQQLEGMLRDIGVSFLDPATVASNKQARLTNERDGYMFRSFIMGLVAIIALIASLVLLAIYHDQPAPDTTEGMVITSLMSAPLLIAILLGTVCMLRHTASEVRWVEDRGHKGQYRMALSPDAEHALERLLASSLTVSITLLWLKRARQTRYCYLTVQQEGTTVYLAGWDPRQTV